MAESRWDLRETEVVISKIKPLKMNKAEEAAVGDHRTIETVATEVKANHMIPVSWLHSTPSHEQQSPSDPSSFQVSNLG